MDSAVDSASRHTLPARSPGLALAVLLGLVLVLQFSPLVGLVGFRLSQDANWTLLGAGRDVGVVLLLALAAMAWVDGRTRHPVPAAVRWALLMVLAYVVLALLNGSGLVLTALNLRRLVLVPLLFVAVWLLPWRPQDIDRVFRWIVASSVLVALFGVIELIVSEPLWLDALDIEGFNAANTLDRFGYLPFAESGRFFTTDLEFVIGRPMRRMASTYLEPTTLAAAMAVLLVVALARRARGHAGMGLVLLAVVAGLATLSKGFAIFLLALMAWRAVGWPAPRHVLTVVLAGCLLGALARGFHLEGPLEHLDGLSTALQYLVQGRLLGEGIGAAGNLSDLGNEVGEESGLGNVIGQVGWVAFLSLLWLRALAIDLHQTATLRRDEGGAWIAAWLMFWTITYLFSASSLGVGGNALGFIVLALYLHPASGRVPA